jgi:Domain of Unknown Function (DUF1080)
VRQPAPESELSPEAINIVFRAGREQPHHHKYQEPQNKSVDTLPFSQLTTKRAVPRALRHDPANPPDRPAAWPCVDCLPGKQKRDYNARWREGIAGSQKRCRTLVAHENATVSLRNPNLSVLGSLTMHRARMHTFAFAVGLLVLAGAATQLVPQAAGQTGDGWTTLLDDKNMGDWNKVGESNWRMEDGALVVDKKTNQDPAYLVSKSAYKDFQLHIEFWASDDANSGIFLRCQDPAKIADRSCYEANIFDQRKDPTYGTGGIVHFAEVNPMPKAGGKWNTYEITAKGRQITVVLNGQKTVELHNGLFAEGPFGLQYGAGVMKFRKVAIKPL